jgi:hypothetical protein
MVAGVGDRCVSGKPESEGSSVHLLDKGLPERWQAHTLEDV